jgi:hypothetical protein
LTLDDIASRVDLSPLADLDLTIEVTDSAISGTEKLGPGVKLIVR